MPIPQSCIEALLIESRLSLPYAFRYKKAGLFAWDPPNEPYHFLCEMAPYIEICYAYSGGAGGVPEVPAFCNSGSPVRKAPCRNGFNCTSNSNKHRNHFFRG